MAFENPLGTNNIAIFEASTGLRQYQAVSISSAGLLTNPSTLKACIGVLVSSGTTGSTGPAGVTGSGTVQAVQVYGVAKMLQGTTSGPVIGALAMADANGLAIAGTTADMNIGIFLSGSDSTGVAGTTDDEFGVVSVLLLHLGAVSS